MKSVSSAKSADKLVLLNSVGDVPIPVGGGTDSPRTGMDMPPSSQQRPHPAAPPVRVEVRHGAAPPVGFDVLGDEFVVGSVPGCDLRIPGANLPPKVCIIQRT